MVIKEKENGNETNGYCLKTSPRISGNVTLQVIVSYIKRCSMQFLEKKFKTQKIIIPDIDEVIR